MAQDKKNILSAILEAIPEIGMGLQEAGVGINAMTGASTDAQTIAALKALDDLKKGRLSAKDQREMHDNFQTIIAQPGAQQKITRNARSEERRVGKECR